MFSKEFLMMIWKYYTLMGPTLGLYEMIIIKWKIFNWDSYIKPIKGHCIFAIAIIEFFIISKISIFLFQLFVYSTSFLLLVDSNCFARGFEFNHTRRYPLGFVGGRTRSNQRCSLSCLR